MAGTFTSSRTLPHAHPLRWRTGSQVEQLTTGPGPYSHPLNWGPWVRGALLGMDAPFQTTTSYRTGRQGSGTTSNDDDELLGSKNYAQRFRAMRKEYKNSSFRRPADTGHPFYTTKTEVILSHPEVRLVREVSYGRPRKVYEVHHYQGPLIPDFRFASSPYRQTHLSSGTFNSGYYGPRAIAATTPTNPVSDLAVTLAEIKREGLAKLPFIDSHKPGGLSRSKFDPGGEYLNVEFGWKPLVGATVDTMRAVSESARLLQQFQRDSGRLVRRDWTFPQEVEQTLLPNTVSDYYHLVDPVGAGMAGYFSQLQGGNSWTLSESTRVTRDVWFKGAYSYYLQSDNSHLNKLIGFGQKANHLLGLRVTPEVIWELAPWSWLADWNGNIGDNIANASALSQDGLVLRYGYLMCRTVSDHTMTIRNARNIKNEHLGDISITWRRTTKERVKAEPYGFGSNPQAYSSRQWAILAALGMTKAQGILN